MHPRSFILALLIWQANQVQPTPRFVDLHLLGIDLLHDGPESVQNRFGPPAEKSSTAAGMAYRYRDSTQGILMEIVFDEESSSVRFARLLAIPRTPGTALSRFFPTRPHSGKGISLGDERASLVHALGPPISKEFPSKLRTDFLYSAAASSDGRLPRYRARYSLTGGKLAAIAVRIGE